MDEFASGVLVAAVLRALAEDGIVVEESVPSGALVPLAVKRRLLAEVVAAHGVLPLLRVGLVLPRLPSDPAIAALAAATGPGDLFARWGRLERFVHSRHRVVVHAAEQNSVVAEHVGPAGEPPTPAEDALVLGVLTALLLSIGVRGLTVAMGERPVFAGGGFVEVEPRQSTARWRFAWTSLAPPSDPGRAWAGDDPVRQVRALLAGNLVRRWTLQDLAAGLGMSARSVQRRLRDEGGFSALLARARMEAAAALLIEHRHALGVVGFASGYTDQPHFTREFRRRTAMTPAAYRQAFTKARQED